MLSYVLQFNSLDQSVYLNKTIQNDKYTCACMFILAWTLNTYVNVSQSLNIQVHVELSTNVKCYAATSSYITYHITVM